MISKSSAGIEVKTRRRLDTAETFDKFMDLFMEKLQDETGEGIVITDLDLSQNRLTVEQWSQVTTALDTSGARVMRFRLFGSPTLDDDVVRVIAEYLGSRTTKEAPLEMHLSDCAITTAGFEYLMDKLEDVEYLPVAPKAGSGKPSPLYIRLENNFIDEKAIQARVDSGLIRPFTKNEGRPHVEAGGSKVSLMVMKKGQYQQKTGMPPAPEDAPPPKSVHDKFTGTWPAKGQHGGKGAQHNGKGAQKGNNSGAIARWTGGAGGSMQRATSGTPVVQPWVKQSPGVMPRMGQQGGKGLALAGGQRGAGVMGVTAPGDRRPTSFPAGSRPSPAFKNGPAANIRGSMDRSRTPMGRGNTGAAKGKGAGKGKQGKSKPLPTGWEEHFSKEHNLNYFWNTATGQSVWERPVA